MLQSLSLSAKTIVAAIGQNGAATEGLDAAYNPALPGPLLRSKP